MLINIDKINKLSKKCFVYIFLLNMRKKTLNWIYDESFFWFLEKKYFEKLQNFILRKNIVYDVFMVYKLIIFEKIFLYFFDFFLIFCVECQKKTSKKINNV